MDLTPNGFPLIFDAPKPRPRFREADFADQGRSIGALWDSANSVYESFIELFGCAVTLAATLFLNRRDLPMMKEWMHSLERFVRRLILAEALARKVDRKPQAERGPHASPRKPDLAEPDLPKPDLAEPDLTELDLAETPPHDWRVSPRLLHISPGSSDEESDEAGAGLAPSGGKASLPARYRFDIFSGPAFARRLEALRRVIVWPEPWIARLAARMARAETNSGQRIEIGVSSFDGFTPKGRPWPTGWAELRVLEHIAARYARRPKPDD